MRNHERRLNRLESRHNATTPDGPAIVFICGQGREPEAALIVGNSETLEREPGESLEAFERRAGMAGNGPRVCLPRREPLD